MSDTIDTPDMTNATNSTDAGADRDPVIDLSTVTFGYTATPVLEDVSLAVDPGEYAAVVGPNGSGKSTLLKVVLGLVTPDSGSARLFGEPSRSFDNGARIGYVPQHADAAVGMPITVREVVKMGRFPHVGVRGLSDADWDVVDAAIETVGMAGFATRRIGELSGGQRQRAFIARALAGEADLLVLDEPTVGVDIESVEAFYDLLDALNEDGMTIVLIEHDLGAVTDHAERVVCLNRTVRFDGSTEEFLGSDALARAFGATVGAASDGGDRE